MDLTNPALRFTRTQRQLACELDGEIALLNLDSKLYFGLKDVAATIWRTLETPQTCEAVVAAVVAEFEVEAEQCREEIRTFLGVLRDRRLLEIEYAA